MSPVDLFFTINFIKKNKEHYQSVKQSGSGSWSESKLFVKAISRRHRRYGYVCYFTISYKIFARLDILHAQIFSSAWYVIKLLSANQPYMK